MCTNLMLTVPTTVGQSEPKTYVSARAMEMPGIIEQALYVMPGGQSWPLQPAPPQAAVPNPMSWTSTYNFVGIASSDSWQQLPNFNDGLNDQGLSVGALWLQPGTQYPEGGAQSVSSFDLPAWILGQCATVGDVRTALLGPAGDGTDPLFTVAGPQPVYEGAANSFFVPLHYVVTDATGASIVIEFVGGATNVYDSSDAVMTNAPTYDWQTTNVDDYYNLSLIGPATSTSGTKVVGGQLLGLPGDSLPSSRFVRAWILSQGFNDRLAADGRDWLPAPAPLPGMNAGLPEGFSGPEQTAVVVAMQLVQSCMGTPYGVLLEQEPMSPPTYGDYTMWTSVRDHTNLNYYFVNAFSAVLSAVDLGAIDFASMPAYGSGGADDSTTSAKIQILPPQESIASWSVDVTSQLAAPVSA
jgi:choloylglycine hydrolase